MASHALSARIVTPSSVSSLSRSEVPSTFSSACAPRRSNCRTSMPPVRASRREEVNEESRGTGMKAATVAFLSALAMGQVSVSPALAAEMYEGRSDLPESVLKEGLPPGRPSPLSGPTNLTKNANAARKNSVKTFDRLFGKAKDAASDAQGTAEKGAAVATSMGPSLLNKAKDKADSVVGNLSLADVGEAKAQAGQAADSLKGTIQNAEPSVVRAGKTVAGAAGTLGGAKQAADETGADAKGKAGDFLGSVKANVDNVLGNVSTIDLGSASGTASSVASDAKSTVNDAAKGASKSLGGAGSTLADAKNSVDKAAQDVKGDAGGVLGDLKGKAEGLVGNVVGNVSTVDLGGAKDAAADAKKNVDKLVGSATSKAGDLGDVGGQVAAAKGTADSAAAGVKADAGGVLGDLKGKVDSLVGNASS